MLNALLSVFVFIINRLASLRSWISATPWRLRAALLVGMIVLAVLLLTVPSAIVLAGQAPGGSNP